ncbi:LpxL/LpxP family acyltransferase [Aureispira anguillae]|uniref:Lipid A biosynthesis acyltransferase n=1 Tax=Aureispira anguillae TaxID=2864201 RepID=A0A915YLW9_9BACT|nr:hypothetical protein [Aureispira anguillae]BDS15632.1 hypothetical protein AsAng_0064160 [Aureispira anguillae]
MASWKGKTRGGLLGYKIFVFILKYMGLRAAYLLLVFVSFYFVLFSPTSTKSIYSFFRKRLRKGRLQSCWAIYRTYFSFGQALIDRTAVLAGLNSRFTYNFDGEEHIRTIAKEGQGGVLISIHGGNWSMAGSMLEDNVGSNARINIVMLEAEHQKIQAFLEKIQVKQSANIIGIGDDFSHIIAMGSALRNGELLCMHGDRFLPGAETVVVDFLGEKAHLPAGPFQLITRMKVPYTIVFAFKETTHHYHYYSTPPYRNPKSVQEAAQYFATSVEEKIKQYPYQWYNFYDFWAVPEQPKIVSKKRKRKPAKQ